MSPLHARPAGAVRRSRRCRRGFNLVELLIALAITASLLSATMVALDASFMAYQTTTELASTHTVSRLAMQRMLAMIRTGRNFGPFPVNPQDSLVESNFIEFEVTDETSGATRIIALRWVETDPILEDNSLYINVDGTDYLLLQGVVAQEDGGGDPVAPFTLEYAYGSKLYRATIDLMIVPDDNQSTDVDEDGLPAQPIHLVASAMPRAAAWE